tara:strand:- start:717 stop:938 length:222 start_codon:yes stop_codon:yes gene_type:complete
VTFEYQAGLLAVQETSVTFQGTETVWRSEFDYDTFENLVAMRQFLNGTPQASLTREYERRLLSAIPAVATPRI